MSNRGAVFQLEVDRKRWGGINENDISYSLESQAARLRHIAHTAINDTLRNGGTFVLIVAPDTITMVQRPDAETP